MKIPSKLINFFIYGFGQSINLLSPLIVTPYIIKICKAEGLGKIGIAFSVCLIIGGFIDYSSYLNGTRDVVINKKDFFFLSEKIADIFTYKTLIFVVFTLLFSIIVISFPSIHEKKLLLLSLPILLAQLLNPNWALQGLENFKLIAFLNVVSKIIYIVLVFSFIRHIDDYIWVNFYLGISGVIVYFIAFLYLVKKYNLRFGRKNISNGIKIIKNDFNICISEVCLGLYQYLPIVIVGYFTGNTAAGIYRIIEQVFSVFRTFIFMFFNYSYANVCDEVEKNINKGIKVWKTYHFVNLGIIMLGCLTVLFFSNYVLKFFHVNPIDYSNVKPLLQLALLVPFFLVISQALRQLMFALGLTTAYSKIIYFSCILSVLLLSIFIYFYGLKGSFIAMILIEIIIISLYILALSKKRNLFYEN